MACAMLSTLVCEETNSRNDFLVALQFFLLLAFSHQGRGFFFPLLNLSNLISVYIVHGFSFRNPFSVACNPKTGLSFFGQ